MIGWSQKMRAPKDLDEISTKMVALEAENSYEDMRVKPRGRRLSWALAEILAER